MLKYLLLLILLIGLGVGSDVTVLTEESFDKLTSSGTWLLEFYAPWCGHCKNLAPIYEELATQVKDKFNIAKIDCTVETELQKRYNIKGFPTIKLLKGDKIYDYSGQRTVEAFVTYLESGYINAPSNPIPSGTPKQPAAEQPASESGSPSNVIVLTESTFDQLTSKGTWLLEFYAPWCGHCKNLVPIYEELATKVKGQHNIAKVDCTVEKELQKRFNIKGFPTIKLLKEDRIYDYAGQRTVDSFMTYLETGYINAPSNPFPPASTQPAEGSAPSSADTIVLTDLNFDQLTSKDTWFLEFYAPWCGHCKTLAPIYDQLATELKGTVKVGKIDCTAEKVICEKYGIPHYPSIFYRKDNELREYNSERTLEEFKKFAEFGWKSVTATSVPGPIYGQAQLFAMPGQLGAKELTELVSIKNEVQTLKEESQNKDKIIAELTNIILELKPSALPPHLHAKETAPKAA